MNPHIILAVVVAVAQPKALPQRELKAVEGKWTVEKFVHPDAEVTPDGVIVEFRGGTIDFDHAAAGAVTGLDPATDPPCLDFKVTRGSGALKGGSA